MKIIFLKKFICIINLCLPQGVYLAIIQNTIERKSHKPFAKENQGDADFQVNLQKYFILPRSINTVLLGTASHTARCFVSQKDPDAQSHIYIINSQARASSSAVGVEGESHDQKYHTGPLHTHAHLEGGQA